MPENYPFSSARPDGIASAVGIDYGRKRVGIAVGQTVTRTAQALPAVRADKERLLWQHLDSIVARWQPDALVVGLPLHMDGATQPLTRKVQAFMKMLKKNYGLPVFAVDERLSTVEAKSSMDSRKSDLDSEAARIILESWLQQPEHGGDSQHD